MGNSQEALGHLRSDSLCCFLMAATMASERMREDNWGIGAVDQVLGDDVAGQG